MLFRSLNKELDPSWNIRVIVIQPGGVRTRWANGNMLDLPFPPGYDGTDALPTRFREMIKNNVAMNDSNKGTGSKYIVLLTCRSSTLNSGSRQGPHCDLQGDKSAPSSSARCGRAVCHPRQDRLNSEGAGRVERARGFCGCG